MHVTHASKGTWYLVLSELPCSKATVWTHLIPDFLFFPLQTRELEHNHRRSLRNRPVSARRIGIKYVCVFFFIIRGINWNSAQFGVDYFY